jgi:hypothetical protein
MQHDGGAGVWGLLVKARGFEAVRMHGDRLGAVDATWVEVKQASR